MKAFTSLLLGFLLTPILLSPARAAEHPATIISPDHDQTFAYGSVRHQAWIEEPNGSLALSITFTNDPYVDRVNQREYDDFTLRLPDVRLGPDLRTFYYHPAEGDPIAVAIKSPDFLGVEEIQLLPTSHVVVLKPHGYLTLMLRVNDAPLTESR